MFVWLLTRAVASAIVLGALAGLTQTTAEQSATPSGTPQAGTCSAEPRPTTFIVDVLALPEPEIAPTAISEVPRGSPADAATQAAVLAVLDQLIACVNAGDYLRAFALYDDHYLRLLIDPKSLMSDDVAVELGETFATPEPVADEDAIVLHGVRSVEVLGDGSVIVVFETTIGLNVLSEPQIDLLVFREFDDVWNIVDGMTDISQVDN